MAARLDGQRISENTFGKRVEQLVKLVSLAEAVTQPTRLLTIVGPNNLSYRFCRYCREIFKGCGKILCGAGHEDWREHASGCLVVSMLTSIQVLELLLASRTV